MEESQKKQTKLSNSFENNKQKDDLRVSASQKNIQKDSSEQQFQFTQINDINPIILLKKPKSYKQCFEYLFRTSGQLLQNQNYDQSIQFYEKTVQMLDIGKKVITKQSYPQIQIMRIIIFANMACAFLNVRKLQKCNKYAQKAIDQIEKYLTSAEKQTFLKISITLMVLKFQNCAILSQLQQHQRSLQLCKSNLSLIKKYLQLLEIFVHDSLKQSYQRGKSKQTVSFSRQVFKFAAITIKQLLQYIQQPMLKKQEMVFYYWQKNPEKNEQQLLKKFLPMENENCKRSILGVSKKNHWIDEFNIGSVMHMTPLKLQELTNIYPIQEYVFKDKLYQITIYCSMCYFTMATEMRFIDSNLKSLSQSSNKQIQSPQIYKDSSSTFITENDKKSPNIGNVKLMKKYGYSQKTQMFKRSQVYHLCSIDVMSKVVKYAIPYINHIIRSYQKHYIKQKKLQLIFAIPEESYLEQDTIVNQSVAQYCNYQTKVYQKPSSILPPRSFSKNGKSDNTFNAQTQKIKFQRILQEEEHFQKIIIEDFQPNKLMQKKSSENLQSPLQNSGQYLQSVIKKKKSRKSSRIKPDKNQLKESKQTKQTKQTRKKITTQKSPNHSIPIPPKPPVKKKKV